MILGNRCTRGCGFCSVPKLHPRRAGHAGSTPAEPANVARMAADMKLRYVVITSVNRDDLADGGSRHFAETVREVRRALPDARVEVLTPDFCGDLEAVARVLDAGPHVFNHNMETVPRLYRRVRPQADYRQSLACWRSRADTGRSVLTKSGFMVGLGETRSGSARRCCAICARRARMWPPSASICSPRAAICRWRSTSSPEQFEAYRDYGLALGFKMVFSGPLVRSSYMADEVSEAAWKRAAVSCQPQAG